VGKVIKTSNKLPSVHSTSKEEPEKGPNIINFIDGSHGFERPDGLYEVFVIDAKGKFIKNKTVKGKKTKEGIAIIDGKKIADSTKTAISKSSSNRRVYLVMRRNVCSNSDEVDGGPSTRFTARLLCFTCRS